MRSAPTIGIPPLAGVCSSAEAARVGYSVDENVGRLLRYHWAERRLYQIALAHLPATPIWEVKCGLTLHQWQDAEHAQWLRSRIMELRQPTPGLDTFPDAALEAFFAEVERSQDTVELLVGLYRVARGALVEAYRAHLARTNPLVDQPTRRQLRLALLEDVDAFEWGARALDALLAEDARGRARAGAWEQHLTAYVRAAGGIAGDVAKPAHASLPPPRAVGPFRPELHPRRDARFRGRYNFNFPPHQVYNAPQIPADERNLALLCKRLLEMDVPEMMASFLTERRDQPWEYHVDFARQLWDEARHAMMGQVAFEARGVDWTRIPLNIGFSLRLNLHAPPLERQLTLYAIEQSLMPGDTGKRFEYQTAVEAGDELSAHFHDYDWADEVLHAHIGRRWLKAEGLSVPEAMARAQRTHDETWAALDQYKHLEEQSAWWADFVREVLGKESAVRPELLPELKILAE